MTKWRHTPADSFMSKLLARPETYQEDSHWGNKCRRVLGVPRVVYEACIGRPTILTLNSYSSTL